jgi:small subunit ribosomal protein S3e
MKFKDGYMISSGHPVNLYIDSAVRHVLLRQVWCLVSDVILLFKHILN